MTLKWSYIDAHAEKLFLHLKNKKMKNYPWQSLKEVNSLFEKAKKKNSKEYSSFMDFYGEKNNLKQILESTNRAYTGILNANDVEAEGAYKRVTHKYTPSMKP